MHVVKLGGSLLDKPRALREWLAVIARAGRGRLVLVPGGGPFADAVRTAQAGLGFDDGAAHRMALLAMDQCGLLLASLESVCIPCASTSAIRKVLVSGGVPVWMPSRPIACAEGVPESWDVTSDSLAAWLARELGASTLWLVKACAVAVQDWDRLAVMGVVDPAFPRFCADARFRVRVVGPGDTFWLTEALIEEPSFRRPPMPLEIEPATGDEGD